MEYLHPKSIKLLKLLNKKKGKAKLEEFKEEGIDQSSVMRAALWLKEDKFVEINEKEETVYKLTTKGEEEYIKGLPEKRLVQELEKGKPVKISDLKGKIKDLEVGIGEAKKKNWIEITSEKGKKKIKITEKGRKEAYKKTDIENALEKLQKGLDISNETIINELLSRGLVHREKDVEKEIILTEKGKVAAKKVDEIEYVSQLSPKVIRSGLWKELKLRKYNVEAPVKILRPGKKQPYKRYLDQVRKRLLEMGFKEVKTPLVELEFWNFDVLFQAQDHPAREIHDKFELEFPEYGEIGDSELMKRVKKTHETGWNLDSLGWGYSWNKKEASRLILRSHTTAASARMLARNIEAPAKVFTIDRVFRPDKIDKKHFIEFFQMEGIVKAEGLTLRDLLGYLKVFGKDIAGADRLRFRPGYFPFTEPSVELDAYHRDLGWIELAGAGMFRPEVLRPLGVDVPVIAWGIGIGRFAMLKLGIEDIRELVFPRHLDKLRRSRVINPIGKL